MEILKSGDIIYNVDDFPYRESLLGVKQVRKRNGNNRCCYLNVSSAFDIETTSIEDERPFGFMYHWQWCVNHNVVFGRTWDEFITFYEQLISINNLTNNNVLVVYVHNLSFEFQFIKDFIHIYNVFAREKRKVLKCSAKGIEFRCSYYLSNMSLAKFCENSKGVVHYKVQGKFDYTKIRTSASILSDTEKQYCYNDVAGLCECIDSKLEEDTIASIPLTSTGYVRRDFRNAMKTKENRRLFEKIQLNADMYKMMKKAFRGGNTHANRHFANKIVKDVYSFDKQSSYPASMLYDEVPMGKFAYCTIDSQEKLDTFMDKYCLVLDVSFYNIKTDVAIPYLDIAHTEQRANIVNDNGRILSADYVRITLTNVDLDIIRRTYSYEGFQVHKCIYARKGLLPREFREQVMHYFEGKTTLKGFPDKLYEYMKSKNKLNSAYGMCVTAIDNDTISYEDGEWNVEKTNDFTLEMMLKNFYSSRNSFLAYQWGVFIVANSRKRLQDAIDLLGNDIVYTDTDSVKFVNKSNVIKIEMINKEIKKICIETNAYLDYKNKRYYLGIWENETENYDNGCYEHFKTLGAKKYCYDFKKNGKKKFTITVSGMSKEKGSERVGKIENFNIGEIYHDIGRTVSWYNDERVHWIEVDGVRMKTASNIAVLETTYQLGVTNEYWELIFDN